MEDISVRIARLKLRLRGCVPFCISVKKRKYYYRQFTRDHKRVQERIQDERLAQDLKDYAYKKEQKSQLRALWAQVSPENLKTVRSRVRFYLDHGLPADPTDESEFYTTKEHNVYLDGTIRRSKTEIIISLLLTLLGIPYRYEPLWEIPGGGRCFPDFVFQDMTAWEHLGKMSDEKYRADQEIKFEKYGRIRYDKSTNLLLTGEHYNQETHTSYIDLREFVKKLVEFRKISVRKARKLLKKS